MTSIKEHRQPIGVVRVLSDVHSSLTHLEACDAHFLNWKTHLPEVPFHTVILGDFLDAGVNPVEVFLWIEKCADTVILGNHEDYIFEFMQNRNLKRYETDLWKFVPWTARQLSKNKISREQVLKKCSFLFKKNSLQFAHASEKTNTKAPSFFDNPKKEVGFPVGTLKTWEIFNSKTCPSFFKIKFSGHTHYSQSKVVENTLFVNAGSVGYPLFKPILEVDGGVGTTSKNANVASNVQPVSVYLTIVEFSDGHFEMEWHRVNVSILRVCKAWISSGCLEECAPFSFAVLAQILFGEDVVHEFFHKQPPYFVGPPNGCDMWIFLQQKGLVNRIGKVFETEGFSLTYSQILKNVCQKFNSQSLRNLANICCMFVMLFASSLFGFSSNAFGQTLGDVNSESLQNIGSSEEVFQNFSEQEFEEVPSATEETIPNSGDSTSQNGSEFGTTVPPVVLSIYWSGLKKTKQEYVSKVVSLNSGAVFSQNQLERDLQKLRNTRLFSAVSAKVTKFRRRLDLSSESSRNSSSVKMLAVKIEFSVVEKWTLIPIFRGGFAGGTSFFYLGAYELNAFGKGIVTGAQYENVFGESGLVAWYKHPKLLGQNQTSEIDFGVQGKPRFFFFKNELFSSLSVQRKFVEVSETLLPLFGLQGFGLQFGLLLAKEKYTEIPFKNRYLNEKNNVKLPLDRKIFAPKIKFSLGVVSYNEERIEGLLLEPSFQFSHKSLLSNETFRKLSLVGYAFKNLNSSMVFAGRAFAGYAYAANSMRTYSVGGLDGLRGFPDGFVSGQSVYFSNVELRSRFYKSPFVILQHVVFADSAYARNSYPFQSEFGEVDESEAQKNSAMAIAQLASSRPFQKSVFAASAGMGLRLLVPPIARMNWRADYGFAIVPKGFSGLVIGMQQYF